MNKYYDQAIVKLPYKGHAQSLIKEGKILYSDLTIQQYLAEHPDCIVMNDEEFLKMDMEFTEKNFVHPLSEVDRDYWMEQGDILPAKRRMTLNDRFDVFYSHEATISYYHGLNVKDCKTGKYYAGTQSIFLTEDKIIDVIMTIVKE